MSFGTDLLELLDEPEKTLALAIYTIDGGSEEEDSGGRSAEEQQMANAVEAEVTKRAADLANAFGSYIEEKLKTLGVIESESADSP